MRTTLNLDDDVLQKVKDYAESRSLSVGRAVSELVRKGAVHSHSYPDCERNPSLRHSRRFPMYYGKKSEGTRIRTRMTVFLLDVNVLIGLSWPAHESHEHVLRWFARNAVRGWATCPFTQAAFVRISSSPAFSPHAVSPQEALRLLNTNRKHPGHRFGGMKSIWAKRCAASKNDW